MSNIFDVDFWKKYDVNIDNLNVYLDYLKQINSYGKRRLDYCEKHHIVPKCVDNTLSNDKNNIIILKGSEHLYAHKLLTNCFNNGKITIKMCYAYKRMTESKHKVNYNVTDLEYECAKKKFSDSMKGENNPSRFLNKESIEKMANTQRKRLSDPTKNPMYGRDRSGKNNPVFGKISITNGKDNKFIYESELDNYIKNGWKKGMTQNHTNYISPMKNKKLVWVNNGTIEKHIETYKYESYIENGWKKGRINFKCPNKGKIKVTNGYKNKYISKTDLKKYMNDGYVLWKDRNIIDK